MVVAAGLPFHALAAAPIVGTGPLARLRGLATLARGVLQAWRASAHQSPDVVLVTGGYVSVPLAVAAWLRRIPLAIYLPDAVPGQAVRWMSRFASRIFVTAETARAHLPAAKTVVSGYPVRACIRQADRQLARERLGVSPSDLVVLVVGGSQGAHRLNEAVLEAAPRILAQAVIIHATGERDFGSVGAVRGSLDPGMAARWRPAPFLADEAMADALAAADLAVCRAGAACLGELPARGLPAILVPLAIAGGHQGANAALLAQAGAAVVLPDEACTGSRLEELVLALLDDSERRRAMAQQTRALDQPDAARRIGLGLLELAGRLEVVHA